MSEQWAGGTSLPPIAAQRTAQARSSGTWSSAVGTGEFAALRSVGFEPAGQVMGSAVYQLVTAGTRSYYYDCGYPHAGTMSRSPAATAVSGRAGRHRNGSGS